MTERAARGATAGALAVALGIALGTPGTAAGAQPPAPPALAGARQLVLVTARAWDDTVGTLRRYERPAAGAAWRPVGGAVAVTLGRTGMAWGVGQGRPPAGTPADARGKREGDGRSPAGAYPLVAAFGYEPSGAAAPSAAARLPFHAVTDGSVCVDDPASALYNAVADSAAARSARPDARWASAERMRRVAGYRRGAVVGYNGARVLGASRVAAPAAPAPGRGSCIFLHVWDGAGRPTEGCTAMAEPDMAAALAWLDPAARPALVQLPAPALARLRAPWRLPAP